MYPHPLSSVSRALTLRLRELDQVPDKERDLDYWREYRETADVLVRAMEAMEPRVAPITKRELAERFGRRA